MALIIGVALIGVFAVVVGVVTFRARNRVRRSGGFHNSHYDKDTGRWVSFDPKTGRWSNEVEAERQN